MTWITERKSVLSMVFALLAVLSWINWRDRRLNRWLVVAMVTYVAALLSKSTAVAVPVALAAVEFWRAKPASTRPKVLVPLGAMFAIGLVPRYSHCVMEVHHALENFWRDLPIAALWNGSRRHLRRGGSTHIHGCMDLIFIQTPFKQGPEGTVPWLALGAILLTATACAIAAVRGMAGHSPPSHVCSGASSQHLASSMSTRCDSHL
ncbi:MAG: hypothetical protein U0636_00815 [Phycisphaerales bacterium]